MTYAQAIEQGLQEKNAAILRDSVALEQEWIEEQLSKLPSPEEVKIGILQNCISWDLWEVYPKGPAFCSDKGGSVPINRKNVADYFGHDTRDGKVLTRILDRIQGSRLQVVIMNRILYDYTSCAREDWAEPEVSAEIIGNIAMLRLRLGRAA